jgi:probable biosynthetic protein (TIGR04099 family)
MKVVGQQTLGMPQLTFSGLAENWVLKTCGDNHWQEICLSAGRPSHLLLDKSGNRLYPSFIEIRMTGAPLSVFGENDEITFTIVAKKVSSKRIWSRQVLRCEQRSASIEVEMLTLFMRRTSAQLPNSTISSGDPDWHIDLPAYDAVQDRGTVVNRRNAAADKTAEVDASELPDYEAHFQRLNTFEFGPCPTVDFNGAKLLYFASYQEIVDRAEFEYLKSISLDGFSTTVRSITYRGNIEAGEKLKVEFQYHELVDARLKHACALFRSDGTKIAEIYTEKIKL